MPAVGQAGQARQGKARLPTWSVGLTASLFTLRLFLARALHPSIISPECLPAGPPPPIHSFRAPCLLAGSIPRSTLAATSTRPLPHRTLPVQLAIRPPQRRHSSGRRRSLFCRKVLVSPTQHGV